MEIGEEALHWLYNTEQSKSYTVIPEYRIAENVCEEFNFAVSYSTVMRREVFLQTTRHWTKTYNSVCSELHNMEHPALFWKTLAKKLSLVAAGSVPSNPAYPACPSSTPLPSPPNWQQPQVLASS